MKAEEIIKTLGLKPHPEGGYFKETYRSVESTASKALPGRYSGDRSFSTCIYFLLTAESFSALHRISSDEIFHFYAGDPVLQIQLRVGGVPGLVKLGGRIEKDERPQVIVPRDTWQGARLVQGGKWALLGCTVAPGFDYEDFEMAGEEICVAYPEWDSLLREFLKREVQHSETAGAFPKSSKASSGNAS